MTSKETRQLVVLLHKYMEDLMRKDEYNQKEKDKPWLHRKMHNGVKAQFNHARCIERNLSVIINEELVSC